MIVSIPHRARTVKDIDSTDFCNVFLSDAAVCGTLFFYLHHSLSEQFNAECVTQYPDSIIHRYLTVEIDIGKAAEVPDAINKAIEAAKKNVVSVSLKGTTIPHEVIGEFGAGRVLLKPAAPGTGIIAGGTMRAVLDSAGIRDIRAKSLRSGNPANVVKATFEALKELRTAEEVARMRGISVESLAN